MGSIHVRDLGKAFKTYPKRWDRLLEWCLPVRRARHQLTWVLADINFFIRPGEAVGLIGVNGAGKSTLLKLITGTSQPTTGAIGLEGRVAALLELGMGFQPDLTGRQNAVLSAQLMGLAAQQIDALMPSILEFAEIGDYIDRPLRVYSSGMQMRLAFAVATCVRPDILIVDEALAVGDVFFQQKCFDRITDFTRAGTTLLFVSHSSSTVLSICTRCILLRGGRVAFDGDPADALDLYQADLLGRIDRGDAPMHVTHGKPSVAPAGQEALAGKTGSITTPSGDCVGVQLLDADGQPRSSVVADQRVVLQIDYRLHEALRDPHVGFKIRNRFGAVLFETNSYCMGRRLGARPAGSLLTVQFSFPMVLVPDEYTITVGLSDGGRGEDQFERVLNYLHEVSSFSVLRNPAAIIWSGVVNLAPELRCNDA
jgi:lipopolysaccharide transport system ATP-binding protein